MLADLPLKNDLKKFSQQKGNDNRSNTETSSKLGKNGGKYYEFIE